MEGERKKEEKERSAPSYKKNRNVGTISLICFKSENFQNGGERLEKKMKDNFFKCKGCLRNNCVCFKKKGQRLLTRSLQRHISASGEETPAGQEVQLQSGWLRA